MSVQFLLLAWITWIVIADLERKQRKLLHDGWTICHKYNSKYEFWFVPLILFVFLWVLWVSLCVWFQNSAKHLHTAGPAHSNKRTIWIVRRSKTGKFKQSLMSNLPLFLNILFQHDFTRQNLPYVQFIVVKFLCTNKKHTYNTFPAS